jgi:hypothetical protein
MAKYMHIKTKQHYIVNKTYYFIFVVITISCNNVFHTFHIVYGVINAT